MNRIFIFILLIGFALVSCDDKLSDNNSIDNEKIINYLAINNIKAYHYTEGLYYNIETDTLTKNYPNSTSEITIKYKGYLLDGTVIDSSNNEFVNINLSECIEGWKLGIPLFNKSSKGTIFIPSALGYGGFATPKVPAYSILIYEIELKDFK